MLYRSHKLISNPGKGLPFSLWSLIEVNIAIVCAFMPTLKVIIGEMSTRVYASFTKIESKSSNPRRSSSVTTGTTTYVGSSQQSFFRDHLDRVYGKKLPSSAEMQSSGGLDSFVHGSDIGSERCSISRSATWGERTDDSV